MHSSRHSVTVVLFTLLNACGGSHEASEQPVLTDTIPLHLEEHIQDAEITGSVLPEASAEPIQWIFEGDDGGWQPVVDPVWPEIAAEIEVSEAGIRIPIQESNRTPEGRFRPSLWASVPGLDRAEWSHVLVRARATGAARILQIWYNLTAQAPAGDSMLASVPSTAMIEDRRMPALFPGEVVNVVNDGTWQTYRIRITDEPERGRWRWHGDWRELLLLLGGVGEEAEGGLEIQSITLVPKAAAFGDEPFGRRDVSLGSRYRSSMYMHAPGRAAYRLRIPANGRLDLALGSVRDDQPVRHRVLVDRGAGVADTVFEETWSDPGAWAQRSVDLAAYAGAEIDLILTADAETPGSVALWGSPTVSGSRTSAAPNVILYIIDGGAAEAMTVYGYNRNTTPNIERIAAEGAVFEQAYSNSSWSKPSTTSFMTSLQNSVLGNTKDRFDPLPVEALTMAERFHSAGYQTGVFTSNPWAGSASSLQRAVDWFRDEGVRPPSGSSVVLHGEFWDWREAYPGAPFWAHFQTTDVHGPSTPIAPFTGLFCSPERYEWLRESQDRWGAWRRQNPDPESPFLWTSVWEDLGIDRVRWFITERDVYDEVLAHQDYQLGRFVKRLKATGEWDNTIFVIAADHSYDAGSTDFGLVLQPELPDQHNGWGPMLRSTISRVPLIFVWPGRIARGQRLTEQASMIDVLPTLLELAGLPQPEVLQGRSLAPLLLGTGTIESRPVILDQFSTDRSTGELSGLIEVIDGRWGASLAINGGFEDGEFENDARPDSLLVYDVWEDPLGLRPINEERPDLVEEYSAFLEAQWKAHQALATRFTSEGEVELTAEQLETLRTLGYIQ